MISEFVWCVLDCEDLKKLLQIIRGESEFIEFKEYIDLDKKKERIKLAREIVAIANTHVFGYVFMGINNNGEIVGAVNDKERIEDVIKAYIPYVGYSVHVYDISCPDGKVIAIHIFDPLERLLYVKGEEHTIYLKTGARINSIKRDDDIERFVLERIKLPKIASAYPRRPHIKFNRDVESLIDLPNGKKTSYIKLVLPALEQTIKQ